MTRILAAVALAAVALCLVKRSGNRTVGETPFWAGNSMDDIEWTREFEVSVTISTP